MDPIFLSGWLIWSLIALVAAVLWLALLIRLQNSDSFRGSVPWQALLLTLLAVWFAVNSEWNKMHLLWAAPLAYALPALVFFLRGLR
jgi:hypothetical protein